MVMIEDDLLWEYCVCGRLLWLQNCHKQVVGIILWDCSAITGKGEAESDLKFHNDTCFIHKLQAGILGSVKAIEISHKHCSPFSQQLRSAFEEERNNVMGKKKLDRTIKKSYGFRWGSGCDINRYN